MATYLNKIKILDQSGQVSKDSPFGFGIGMLREDSEGNIVYTGEGNEPVILLKKAKDGTSEYYTLVVPDGNTYTALTDYIDNNEKFLKEVKYHPSVKIGDILQPALQFTFVVGAGESKTETVVNIPIKDLPIEADNIYFTEDLKLTTPFGYYEPGVNGYVNTETATKKLSVQEFFKSALQREDKNPNIVNPSAKFTKPTKSISAELGSKIDFDYEVVFDEGKYPYDTTTGVTVTTASIALGDAKINEGKKLEGSYTIEKLGSTSLTLSAEIGHTEGKLASSNLGNQTDKRISIGDPISVGGITISSYREGFYFRADKSTRTPTINSDYLRDNSTSKTNKGYTGGTWERTVPVGTQAIILACPADKIGITKVLNTTVNADMTNSFTKSTVSVKDAAKENSKNYTVWMYTPAEPYATEATLKITLG